MAHRHFPRQRNMQSKSRYKFFKNPENCKWLKLRKIVYLWRCFSLARKLLMRRFRGALNYILNVNFKYMLQKIFSDKIVSNFDSQEVGPKWHFLSTILQIFTEKLFFPFSLNFAGKILKSRVVLKSSLLVVDRRPL